MGLDLFLPNKLINESTNTLCVLCVSVAKNGRMGVKELVRKNSKFSDKKRLTFFMMRDIIRVDEEPGDC